MSCSVPPMLSSVRTPLTSWCTSVLIFLITKMNGAGSVGVRIVPKHSAFPNCAGLLGTITRITRNNVTGTNAAV